MRLHPAAGIGSRLDLAAVPPPRHTLRAWEILGPNRGKAAPTFLAPPDVLSTSDYNSALEVFQQWDANDDNYLDRNEFHKMMASLSEGGFIDDSVTNHTFDHVDTDGSNSVFISEFVHWVFCHEGAGSSSPSKSSALSRTASEPLFPSLAGSTAPMEGLVFEFTYGPDFRLTLGQITRRLEPIGVQVKRVRKPALSGCERVRALIGGGIPLWDRDLMMAYADYPFDNHFTTDTWLTDMKTHDIPILERVALIEARRVLARRR